MKSRHAAALALVCWHLMLLLSVRADLDPNGRD
jgi:hypothetical protein